MDGVKCSKVGKTCIYHGWQHGYLSCDYIIIKGKRRGCDPENCTRYEKREKA